MADIVIYKGDDTGGTFGRTINFTINVGTGVSLTGCKAEFTFAGISRTWTNVTSGQVVSLDYTAAETAQMPLGAGKGVFRVYDSNSPSKVRTFNDNIEVVVTNDLSQAYPGGNNVALDVTGGVSWDQIRDKPDQLELKDSTTGEKYLLKVVSGALKLFKVTVSSIVALLSASTISDAAHASTTTTNEIGSVVMSDELNAISTNLNSAIAYSRACYLYMNGSTNCWFAGTNYVVDAGTWSNRTHFAWQSDMDPLTVPCSMALWELRYGEKQEVWDQRDWTVWYWNYRIAKYKEERQLADEALASEMEAYAPTNWAARTASGLENAATNTTWIDTPKIVLSAGYAWQHQATVNGVGYWGIQGNGFEVGNEGTNTTLKITDWEGNEVLSILKGGHRLVYITSESGQATGFDDDGYMWYDMKTGNDASAPEPTGEFAIDLDDSFLQAGDTCPAVVKSSSYLSNGIWRCYFKARPGTNPDRCFARYKVSTGTETTVKYSNAPTVGGLIVNGVKIKPIIPNNATVGTTITWQVAE